MTTRKQYIAGAAFILALALIFFRDSIHMGQSDATPKVASSEITAKLLELDRRECGILIEAKQQTIPIDEERNHILGVPNDPAATSREFTVEKEACSKYGVSPYPKDRQ